MAAMIEYVCTAQHDRRGEASVTVEQGSWAYCAWGARSGHEWTRIDPTAIEALRSNGNGRAKLVQAEERQPSNSRRRT